MPTALQSVAHYYRDKANDSYTSGWLHGFQQLLDC